MNIRITGSLSILSSLLFLLGIAGLFILNPIFINEFSNISLTFLNLHGMDGRFWVISLAYISSGITGLLVFGIMLKNAASIPQKISMGLLSLNSLIWISFGLIPYDHNSDLSIMFALNSTILSLLLILCGLLIISSEGVTKITSRPLKITTIISASIIGLLCFLSIFIFNDSTWIRTNVSFLIYSIWTGLFGYYLLKMRTPNIP